MNTIYIPDTNVPSFNLSDKMKSVIDNSHQTFILSPYYAIDFEEPYNDPALTFFFTWPAMMNYEAFSAWMQFGGGQGLLDRVLEPFGLVGFVHIHVLVK